MIAWLGGDRMSLGKSGVCAANAGHLGSKERMS